MTDSEKTLLSTITAQTIARRQPRTAAELEAAQSEADEIAAETIWAERAEAAFSETGEESSPPMEGWTKTYYEHLAAAARADAMMYEDEDQEAEEEEPPTPGSSSAG
jgi:hypothetical protein